MSNFFKFLVTFVVAFACAVLTYLFAQDAAGNGCVVSSLFSGIYCGLATGCAFEFGADSWSKNSLFTLGGGLLGGIIGGILFAFAG